MSVSAVVASYTSVIVAIPRIHTTSMIATNVTAATIVSTAMTTNIAARTTSVHVNMITIAIDATTAIVTYSGAMHVMASQSTIPDWTTIAVEAIAIVAATMSAIIGNPY